MTAVATGVHAVPAPAVEVAADTNVLSIDELPVGQTLSHPLILLVLLKSDWAQIDRLVRNFFFPSQGRGQSQLAIRSRVSKK